MPPASHGDRELPIAGLPRNRGLLRALLERRFGPIQYPDHAAAQVRALRRSGTIVYVTRARSSLLVLTFNNALERLGLPLARFIGGVSMLLWQPIDRVWRSLWRAPLVLPPAWRARFTEAPTRLEAELASTALRGQPALLLLRPPRAVAGETRRERHDFVRALIAVQRTSTSPIFLLPHALADKLSSGATRRTLTERLFGDRRNPGRLRRLAMFLGTMRHASVRLAEPLDLRAFCAENPADDDELLARKVRHELHRRITEEERVVAGPKLPSPDAMERHVLRHPRVQSALEEETARGGKPRELVERRAAGLLRRIASRYNVLYVRVFDVLLGWIFNRIYDGVVVDEAGLRDALDAARRGPVVYCPTHKSHVDYLVLSYVLWRYGIAPPHIAAGANLSFFPLGSIFRRGGAFFLRRSFKDDPLYGAVFRAYVEELIRNGVAIEFFLEGTRSRTGKVLPPRFGLLSMLVDAWRAKVRTDLIFVPVSVDYERIIEARSYERELLGEEKQPETIGALLKTTGVLRSRYGRVLLQFGAPLSLSDLAAQAELPQDAEPQHDAAWRRETERLGHRVLHRAATICSVTPTAVVCTALLCHRGRALPEGALLGRADGIIEYLDTATARLSAPLLAADERRAALLEAVRSLVDEGLVAVDRAGRSDAEPIYRVPEGHRVRLDYHKNAVMNAFAPGAIVARCLFRRDAQSLTYDVLQEDARFLSRLFKREFLYPVGQSFATQFGETVATLAVRGLVDALDDGAVVITGRETLELLATLLDSFVEAYWITASVLRDLRAFPLWDKELQERALDRCRRSFLEGEIRRAEAANLSLIKNALDWLRITGVVAMQTAGKRNSLILTPGYADGGLDELIDAIGAFR